MEISKVIKSGNKFVVPLPKEIIKRYDVKEGDHFEFNVHGESITIKPYKKQYFAEVIKKVAGSFKTEHEYCEKILRIREDETDREVPTVE